jgi:hypothetical protein
MNIKIMYEWKLQKITKNIKFRIYTWYMMAESVTSAWGVYF